MNKHERAYNSLKLFPEEIQCKTNCIILSITIHEFILNPAIIFESDLHDMNIYSECMLLLSEMSHKIQIVFQN